MGYHLQSDKERRRREDLADGGAGTRRARLWIAAMGLLIVMFVFTGFAFIFTA